MALNGVLPSSTLVGERFFSHTAWRTASPQRFAGSAASRSNSPCLLHQGVVEAFRHTGILVGVMHGQLLCDPVCLKVSLKLLAEVLATTIGVQGLHTLAVVVLQPCLKCLESFEGFAFCVQQVE